ncbi:hypothetical protein AMS58_03240 [Pseudoalteromonas porphyrae]|uniref:Uncharacterized protein n=1 Tax=Pseudoalteromonas porphyrae TaxID=187330 RepID=A0A0N1EW00_9GAMM|nr:MULTISPECIES: hypothetical protein [Pseudoalteromonas]KPH64276.1 hypothetical protein ADS77_06205 [Pseudoalteromonas porphyrae]KPH96108.1 hypothetical protein AMS58_03240 [Pseudoalteromonas porphyrae]
MITLAPKEINFEKDFSEQELSSKFVAKNINTESVYDCDIVAAFNKFELIEQIEETKHTLIISADVLFDSEIIKTIQLLVDNQPAIRVYLCLGDDEQNKTAIDRLKSRCLVRTGVAQAGAIFLSDHQYFNKRGVVITELNENGYCLDLTLDQIDDSYRSFCKHFWDNTQYEYIGESKRQSQQTDATIVLNDEYQLDDYFNRKSFKTAISTVNALDLSNKIELEEYATLISNRQFAELNRIAKESSVNIFLTDFNYPNIVYEAKDDERSEEVVWLLPNKFSAGKVNWAIQLNDDQKNNVTESIDKAIEQACWELALKPKVCELVDVDFVSANNSNEELMTIDERKAITLEEKYCQSIEEFLNETPEILFSKQTHWSDKFAAQHITFSGIIHPPYCPKNATKDELVGKWDKVNNQWHQSLSEVESMLNNLSKQLTESSARSFASLLKQFILGQDQKRKKLIGRIDELKNFNLLHSTPAERKKAEDDFYQISLEINQNKTQIAQQINLAEKEHMWDKQNKQLSANKQQAREDVSKAKELLKNKRPQVETLLREIESKYCEEVKTYTSAKTEDNRAALPKELNIAKQFFTNKGNRKKHSKLHQVYNRLVTQHNKANKELLDIEKNTDNLEKRLATIIDDLERHEQNKPKAKSLDESFDKQLGLKDKKQLKITWPSEDLPVDDLPLMQDKGKRYLVIKSLDEYDIANKEASRLKATVCTFKNGDVYA